jgi:hypothetical protein
MQNLLDTEELIQATKKFLEQEILPAHKKQRHHFRLQVALNALSIVQREIASGPAVVEQELLRLRQLLAIPSSSYGDGETEVRALRLELARRIREGEADQGPWRPKVLETLRTSVQASLWINSPKVLGT